MSEKIYNAIADILETLSLGMSFEDIEARLNNDKKYDKKTIAAAFSWLLDKILLDDNYESEKSGKSFRIFSEQELRGIGKENCDYLIKLNRIGVISNAELEDIVEKLISNFEGGVDKRLVNYILMMTMAEIDEKAFPGSRILLSSSDKIN